MKGECNLISVIWSSLQLKLVIPAVEILFRVWTISGGGGGGGGGGGEKKQKK